MIKGSEGHLNSSFAQPGNGEAEALLHGAPVRSHDLLQRTTAGNEGPGRLASEHPLGIDPEQHIHALLAQPLHDEKRGVLHVAALLDLGQPAPVRCHQRDPSSTDRRASAKSCDVRLGDACPEPSGRPCQADGSG